MIGFLLDNWLASLLLHAKADLGKSRSQRRLVHRKQMIQPHIRRR